MKKRIGYLVIVLCSFFGILNVQAKVFNEVRDYENYFLLEEGENKLYKFFITIADANGTKYFNVRPHVSYAPLLNYIAYNEMLPIDMLVDFSKIIYFGYGYEGNITDDYYYATQYLLYERAMKKGSSLRVVDATKTEESSRLDSILPEIRSQVKKHTFSLSDKTVNEKKLVIEDAYVLKNFTVSGENVEIYQREDSLEVNLLLGTDFVLNFQPKSVCTARNMKLWEMQEKGILLLHMDRKLCEQEYSIQIHYEEPAVEEEPKEELLPPSKEEIKEESTANGEENIASDNKEFVQEFEVPSTSKYSLSWLYLLFLLGNVYYVFKK